MQLFNTRADDIPISNLPPILYTCFNKSVFLQYTCFLAVYMQFISSIPNGAKSSKLDARKMSHELNSASIPASLKVPAQVPNSMLSSKKVVAHPPTGPPHPPSNRSLPCELYDNINRVVVLGHVIHSDSKMIHGKKMRDDCLRVSVDLVEIKTAILPCPSGDFVTMYDAHESIFQWPKHLVVLVGNERTRLDAFDEFLKRAKEVFKSRAMIEVELHRNVFGQTVDVPIQMAVEDIEFVCTSQKLTNNAIVLFIRFLYEKLDGDACKNKFGFMNPAAVHLLVNKTEFVKNVLNRLKDSVPIRKYIFIPCNTGLHWVLIVFLDGVFYYLNSLDEKCRYKLEEQISIVSKALRKLGVKRSEEKVFWVDVKHNPKQKGDWECGFFVMLYMKHIIESYDTSMRNPKEMFKEGMNYGTSEIDEIRREWTDYISPILENY
ncbi:hypothetical protein MKX03_008641 [Papaver bracteatum]|nr:hypothetical protein MKX03_008641 [Papaver bracteatum]